MSSLSSLVADYGSTSSSNNSSDSDNDTDSEPESHQKIEHQDNTPKLPPPEFGAGSHLSVFSNPFVEAENAKKAILEKHVKMTPSKEETTMINGKRICWNYRKGRCRFGHNCKFAHDSDLHRSVEFVDDNLPEQVILAQHTPGISGSAVSLEQEKDTDDQLVSRKKKKRPGLGDNIVPGKKVMKMYMKQKR